MDGHCSNLNLLRHRALRSVPTIANRFYVTLAVIQIQSQSPRPGIRWQRILGNIILVDVDSSNCHHEEITTRANEA